MRSETTSRCLYNENKKWISVDAHLHIVYQQVDISMFSVCVYVALKGKRLDGRPLRKILRMVYVN